MHLCRSRIEAILTTCVTFPHDFSMYDVESKILPHISSWMCCCSSACQINCSKQPHSHLLGIIQKSLHLLHSKCLPGVFPGEGFNCEVSAGRVVVCMNSRLTPKQTSIQLQTHRKEEWIRKELNGQLHTIKLHQCVV